MRLTVKDGGVAGPGGHDEDVDEFDEDVDVDVKVDGDGDVDVDVDDEVAGPGPQMVMMLHLHCPVVKMFPLSSIFQNISKGIIPNMRRWRHVVRDIGKKKKKALPIIPG